MRAAVFRKGNATPTVEDWPEPTPQNGEVKVAVRAAALNHRDVWITKGMYPGVEPPIVLGSDGVGELDGNRVLINPGLHWGPREDTQSGKFEILGSPRDGTFAEFVVVPQENVHPCPAHLGNAEAAALPLAGLTAWRALMTRASAKTTDTVLITGAGGGVSSFAVQFAVALGCRVFVTSSQQHKIDAAVSLGAAGGVRYTDADWIYQLKSLTGGLDVVIDSAGGEGFTQLTKLMKPAGRMAFYGGTVGPIPKLSPQALFYKQLTLAGTTMGSPREFEAVLAYVIEHNIKPVIDSVRPLAEIGEAFARMAAGKQLGKLVVEV